MSLFVQLIVLILSILGFYLTKTWYIPPLLVFLFFTIWSLIETGSVTPVILIYTIFTLIMSILLAHFGLINRNNSSFLKKRTKKRFVFLIILLLLLLINLTVTLLKINNFYIIYFIMNGYTVLGVINVILISILALLINMHKLWIFLGVVLASLNILVNLFLNNFSIATTNYEFIHSPEDTETIMVEYSVVTLGESNYSYDVYHKLKFPGLIRKLNEESISIIVKASENTKSAKEVLGLNSLLWTDEKTVIIKSRDIFKKYKLE